MIQKYENDYNAAFQHAVETKKLYIADAVQQDSSSLLNRLHVDDWSSEQRLQAYKQEVLPYWEKFRLAPDQMWFELYGSRDHRM